MATEKYFCFDEQGELKRIKGRLVRFLDNEAPTGSDKSAIRTSLEVSPDAEGLVQADVGTAPNEIPVNGMLGDMAYQSSDSVSVDTLEVTDKVDGSLGIDVTPTASKLEVSGTTNSSLMMTRTSSGIVSNLEDAAGYGSLLLYQAGGSAKVSIQGNGNSYFNGGSVGIGGSPSELLHLTNATAGAGVDANIRFSPTTSTTRYAEIQAVNTDGNNNIDLRFFTAPAGTPVERLRIDSQGRVGVAGAPGSYAYSGADDLVVGDATGSRGITISSGSSDTGALYFGDAATTGLNSYRGMVRYSHSSDSLELGSLSQVRWTINSTGNLVAGSGLGIDFGSAAAAGRTVESGLLDDYERGQWSPRFEMTGANFATVTMEVVAAHYVKIGRFVHCQAEIRTDNIDATGASGSVAIQGLPFTSESTSGNSSSLSVGYGAAWVTAPASGYVPANSTYAVLTRYTTTGTSTLSASDLTAGATADRNQLNFSVSYVTAS
jgi:hypothetical protein